MRTRAKVITSALLAVTLGTLASPALAAPWTGDDITYGPGVWEPYSDYFTMDDVYLIVDPLSEPEYTDLWDGAGETALSSASLSLDGEIVYCDTDADVDLTIDSATSDPVLTCNASNAAFVAAGLDVVSEIRILTGGEIVRFTTTIANTTDAEVTIDAVAVGTNFGSYTNLFDYENETDAVLTVPFDMGNGDDVAAQLNSVGARWAVNQDVDDAPGGIVIGGPEGAVPGEWSEVAYDDYYASFGPFTIPAGETRAIVTFATWDPQTLIAGGYTNSPAPELIAASAAQVVADMAQFDTLTEALAVGLDPAVTVINWEQLPVDEEVEEEQPELAETGAVETGLMGLSALMLLGMGALLIVTTRRRAAQR